MSFRGFNFGCCCGGVWDFFGWCDYMDEEDADEGRILVRVPSSFESGDDTDSYPEWSVDIANFNGDSGTVVVWFTHGITDPTSPKDQRVWYFLTKGTSHTTVDGNARIEVVDYDFEGVPTNAATYTVDWTQSLSLSLHPGPDGDPRTLEFSWDSKVRPTAHYISGLPNLDLSPDYQSILSRSDLQSDVDLSDLSTTRWNEEIWAADTTQAEVEQCSDNRYDYWSADYRPARAARVDADKALGYRLTVEIDDAVWEWNGSTWFVDTAVSLTSYELKIVLGDLTVVEEDSSVAGDSVLYTLTGKSLISASGANASYEVESVRCRSLEVVDGDPVGIFLFTDDSTALIRARAPSFPSSPTLGQQYSGEGFWADSQTAAFTNDISPSGGTLVRIDILLPDGTIEDSEVTSFTSDDCPFTVRHALDTDGGSNGNFFMVTGNFPATGFASGSPKLKYMSDATTAIWTKTFDSLFWDIAVSDRFVYVLADKDEGDGVQGYAYDYDGNEYHLQYPDHPHLPLPPPDQPSPSFDVHDYYLQAWAVCRHADAIYPTASYFDSID